MRKNVIETAALVGLLLGTALVYGQQPGLTPPKTEKVPEAKDQPVKSKLEEMLEKALRDNPDVRLAAAKVAEAEAELNRSRLLVVQKVASAYQAVEAQKAAVESAGAELTAVRTQFQAGKAEQAILLAADQKLIEAKAKLASLEAELPYLLGQQAAGVDDKLLRFWPGTNVQHLPETADAEMLRRYYLDLYGRLPTKEELAAGVRPPVQGPTADRIRAALDKSFTYECKEKRVGEVLRDMNKAFQEGNPGLLIKDNTRLAEGEGPALSAHFDKMPFGAVLEWVEDSLLSSEVGTFRVVVRDYGIVVAAKDDLPPGAPLLHDFWKGGEVGDKAAPSGAKEGKPSPTSDEIEGLVQGIDKDLVSVNIGSDAGLAKGQILFVFRLPTGKDYAQYLGKIRVEEIKPTVAVARLESDFKTLPQAGDHVATKFSGK